MHATAWVARKLGFGAVPEVHRAHSLGTLSVLHACVAIDLRNITYHLSVSRGSVNSVSEDKRYHAVLGGLLSDHQTAAKANPRPAEPGLARFLFGF